MDNEHGGEEPKEGHLGGMVLYTWARDWGEIQGKSSADFRGTKA